MAIREEVRANWGTRSAFVLAAIGSAVGLGNLWGFPYKVYTYGGAAFLIPYIVALVVIGIPLMILEFSLGHLTQRAAPDAYGRVNRRLEGFGWWPIILSFVIVTYYAVILAWCTSYLVYSVQGFWGELPWIKGAAASAAEQVKHTGEFFYDDYLAKTEGYALGGIHLKIVAALAVVWVALYFCIFRGVKLVSRIVLWTVPLPWLMLLILTIRGLTLEGATQGLTYYLEPDWHRLLEPTTWRWAFGQTFFSLSLAFGIMITYASFLHRKSDLNNNAAIVSLADLGTSFIAGIAVFATLGGMALASGVGVKDVTLAGPGLTFHAFPYALSQLPHPALFSTLFFATLLLLGIDSAFSITEAVVASLVDKTGWRRGRIMLGVHVVGFAVGLIYCTGGGLGWLGNIDGFINGTWGIALVGLLECLIIGWFYGINRLKAHANERSDWKLGGWWTWCIRVVIPVVLGSLFMWSLCYDVLMAKDGYLRSPKGRWHIQNVIGLSLMVLAPIAAWLIGRWRRGRTVEPVHPPEERAPPAGAGFLAAALLVAALAATVGGVVQLLGAHEAQAASHPVGARAELRMWLLLAVALACGLGALLVGSRLVKKAELAHLAPAARAQWASALGVVVIGGVVGLTLSFIKVAYVAERERAEVPAELSTVAYVMLGAFGLVIFGGLAWCFYRAIKAAGAEAEVQAPES